MMQVLNSEIVLFGGSLAKHDVASVQLDSDQESTDEETDTSSNTQVTPASHSYNNFYKLATSS